MFKIPFDLDENDEGVAGATGMAHAGLGSSAVAAGLAGKTVGFIVQIIELDKSSNELLRGRYLVCAGPVAALKHPSLR